MTRCRDCRAEVTGGLLRCDRCAREHEIALLDADYSARRSLHEALSASGYTSRPTPTTITSGTRAILREGGVEVVAELTAHEAWEWLRGGGQ